MSMLSTLLESFDEAAVAEPSDAEPSQDYLEGFAAGRDTALTEIAAQDHKVRAGLQQALSDLAFGYHEAREHILTALAPVLSAIVEKVLPDLARDGFAARVAACLDDIVAQAAAQPVALAVAPGEGEILRTSLGPDLPFPLDIVEDPGLAAGQALVRASTTEVLIDIDAITGTIRETIGAITHQKRTEGHG